MPTYKDKEDNDKFKKAFAAGSSTGKSASEQLVEAASSGISAAKNLLGMNDDEDEKKKKKN